MTNITDLGKARQARADRAEAVLRVHPNPDAPAMCDLAGCGERLYIIWTASASVRLADTADDLADPSNADETSWKVECGAGHVVAVPVDTGAEHYTFGACSCDTDDPAQPGCGHDDLTRLRRVVA
jgi:hypothetical protein